MIRSLPKQKFLNSEKKENEWGSNDIILRNIVDNNLQ